MYISVIGCGYLDATHAAGVAERNLLDVGAWRSQGWTVQSLGRR